jgi:hypothetical protein
MLKHDTNRMVISAQNYLMISFLHSHLVSQNKHKKSKLAIKVNNLCSCILIQLNLRDNKLARYKLVQ